MDNKIDILKIRKLEKEDAEQFLKCVLAVDGQSEFLQFSPGERKPSIQMTSDYIKKMNTGQNILLAAFDLQGAVIGYMAGEVSHLQRLSHVMRINIACLNLIEYRGVGRKLFDALNRAVSSSPILRLEAYIVKENKLSFNLGRRHGGRVEGVKKNSIYINERYHDQYVMAWFPQLASAISE